MAAVTSQSWSVVGKSTKKPAKQVPRTLSKDQRKSFIDKMPRIESQAPVKESSTIYDAFLGKSSSEKSVSSSTKAAPSPRDTGSHKGATNRKKKTETASDKKKDKPMTFDEAINKLDSKDLSSILTRSQTSFPDNEDVWLKDLASYLNVRLETGPDTDPVFKNKPKDFPMSKLNSGCRELLKSTLKGCNSGTVEHLFYHCVQAMLTEMGKGTSTYGYRIFLQSLASQQPNVASNKNSQYLELLKANQNRPAMCLSILWALGLGGTRDLRAGLRVWLDLMVPMMTVRSLASYPVDYLDSLLQYHKDHKSAYGVMTIRDFFPLLDLIFSNTLSLPTDLKKKLIELYPKIKTIAFGADPKTTLRLFFPSFLSRATPESKPLLRNEVLPCLITCLMTDRMCFSVWRQMYIKHLSQSSVLLEHLSENWPQVSRKLEKKLLHETLQTFSVTNDELTGQGRQGPETTGCSRLCRELLLRMSQTAVFSWFWLLFLIVSLVAAIIAYDVYTASNYRMSRSWRFLEEYGILSVLQQGWSHVNSLYNQVFTWLKINVPFYYARTCDTAGPYIRHARIKLVEWYTIVYEATTVQRHWVATKSVEFISWMYNLSPEFWEQVRSGALTAWAVFKDFIFTLARLVVQYAQIAYVWIIDNIINDFSVEKISRLMTTLLLHVQKLGASFVHWCGTVLGTTTK